MATSNAGALSLRLRYGMAALVDPNAVACVWPEGCPLAALPAAEQARPALLDPPLKPPTSAEAETAEPAPGASQDSAVGIADKMPDNAPRATDIDPAPTDPKSTEATAADVGSVPASATHAAAPAAGARGTHGEQGPEAEAPAVHDPTEASGGDHAPNPDHGGQDKAPGTGGEADGGGRMVIDVYGVHLIDAPSLPACLSVCESVCP